LPDGKLGELVNLISTIGFGDDPSKARDILGQVYEYFLGMFASAEGKRGGQFYTPASIVKTLVAVLSPAKGQIYDPCCGSSGMFVQSEKFIEDHGGKLGDVSIYGQEANPTTWRLAAMNLVIRGMDYNLGKEPADTFTRNQHPDLRADYCLANPPFNISDWWHASLDGDARWVYGTPPQGNANYAWLQHILHHLKPTGRAGIVLANGSMSSSQNSEGQIRAAMVDDDVVDLTNLQRQIMHSSDTLGSPKVLSAQASATRVNPLTALVPLQQRADAALLDALVPQANVVLDCSDNFETRHAINAACVRHRVPLVSGAAVQFDGQISVFDPRDVTCPCYACAFPAQRAPDAVACATMGVFAPVVGVIGCMQAAQALMLVGTFGEPLRGSLLMLDGRSMEWTRIRIPRQPACSVCGPVP
jgi:molybdopterin/thiamine biosynthesis adenylyltransferase